MEVHIRFVPVAGMLLISVLSAARALPQANLIVPTAYLPADSGCSSCGATDVSDSGTVQQPPLIMRNMGAFSTADKGTAVLAFTKWSSAERWIAHRFTDVDFSAGINRLLVVPKEAVAGLSIPGESQGLEVMSLEEFGETTDFRPSSTVAMIYDDRWKYVRSINDLGHIDAEIQNEVAQFAD